MPTESGPPASARAKYRRRRLGVAILIALVVLAALGAMRFKRPARRPRREVLFKGVAYERIVRDNPRSLVIHVVKVDLAVPGVGVLVTPPDPSCGKELPARTTSEFLNEFGVQVAINGSFFEPCATRRPWDYEPRSGEAVNMRGLAVSNGHTYSDEAIHGPVVYFGANCVRIGRGAPPSGTLHALSGWPILVRGGKRVFRRQEDWYQVPHPRTAVGADAEGKTLWLVVVDGRQAGYSEGVSLGEFADLMVELGVDAAMNLDGGGSATLVAASRRGTRVLNAPIHAGIRMTQRPVGNHLGIYAPPLDY